MTCNAQGRRRETKRLIDRIANDRLAFARAAFVVSCDVCGFVPGPRCARPDCPSPIANPWRPAALLVSLGLSARLSGSAR